MSNSTNTAVDPDNNLRADAAADAIQQFIESGPGDIHDLATTCVDLIADILHFAKREGHDTSQILRMAQSHYEYEINESTAFPE